MGRDGPRACAARGRVPVPGERRRRSGRDGGGRRRERQGRCRRRRRRRGAAGAAGAAAAEEEAAEAETFTFLRHRYPLVGAHEYGTGAGAFGGGRGHQGQDIFAACDTPVVAARGGKVAFKQFHARAGHYIVIDGAGTGVDYAYMHLRDAALVDTGDRVRTGQLVGYVGMTGRASDCHLHFETWTAPGWYQGGAPLDPLPALQAWDAQS